MTTNTVHRDYQYGSPRLPDKQNAIKNIKKRSIKKNRCCNENHISYET